jgi:hypothetical protein
MNGSGDLLKAFLFRLAQPVKDGEAALDEDGFPSLKTPGGSESFFGSGNQRRG